MATIPPLIGRLAHSLMSPSLIVLPYNKHYASTVSHIFHESIHHIDDDMYLDEDKCAWSASPRSSYHWNKRLSRSQAWVLVDVDCVVNGKPKCCGFINVETQFYSQGYIDSLYVHPDYQGKGGAHQLYKALEAWSCEQGFTSLSVDASKASKALFLSWGFKLRHRSYQEKLGRVIMGFLMEKEL